MMRRDKLMRNPQKEFQSPQRVLDAPELSDKQKIALLMNWRSDVMEIQRADGENMQNAAEDEGDVAAELKRVTDALTQLGADPATGRRG